MTEPPAVASPAAAVSSEFAELASDEQINKAVTPGRVTAIIVNERLGF